MDVGPYLNIGRLKNQHFRTTYMVSPTNQATQGIIFWQDFRTSFLCGRKWKRGNCGDDSLAPLTKEQISFFQPR